MNSTAAPLLGVDIGTTSISIVVVDSASGRNLSKYTENHNARLPSDEPGSYIQNPDILATTALRLISRVREQYPNIAALGITGQMHGIIILDEAGRAISPAYTWLDRRLAWRSPDGRPFQALMKAELGYDVPVGYGVGTLFALQRLGAIPPGARYVAGVPDYVAMRLIDGKGPITAPGLAHSMGCYSLREARFHSDLWRRTSSLAPPEVRNATEVIGETSDGIPVVAPDGDNQASFIAGIRDPDRAISINIGTSGQVSVHVPSTSTDSENDGSMERRPYPGGGTLAVGATLSGGKSFEVLTSLIGDIMKRIDAGKYDPYRLLADLPRPVEGTALQVDTRFTGTRTDPSTRGAITRLGTDNMTLPHLYWGIADGVVTELVQLLADHRRILDASGSYIGISGNAINRSAAIRTILAEKLARPLRRPVDVEASARGAAMLAAATLEGGAAALPAIQSRMIRYVEE